MIPKEFETISEYVCKQTRWTDGSIRHDRMEDVVRCKDCIVFGTHGKNTDICPMWHNTHIDPYRDFCSRGVRKTENSSEIPNNCDGCKEGQEDCYGCPFVEPKGEPLKIELTAKDLQDWKDKMWAEAVVTEPQTDWHYDEQDATWYPYKHEDEPQTE